VGNVLSMRSVWTGTVARPIAAGECAARMAAAGCAENALHRNTVSMGHAAQRTVTERSADRMGVGAPAAHVSGVFVSKVSAEPTVWVLASGDAATKAMCCAVRVPNSTCLIVRRTHRVAGDLGRTVTSAARTVQRIRPGSTPRSAHFNACRIVKESSVDPMVVVAPVAVARKDRSVVWEPAVRRNVKAESVGRMAAEGTAGTALHMNR
jgi:hypothetical protein